MYDATSQEAMVGTVGVEDRGFPWRLKKRKANWLARLYEKAGYPVVAAKVAACSNWLEFSIGLEGGDRTLSGSNFCKQRLCPICMKRKSMKNAIRVSRVMDVAEAKGFKFTFLTLSQANCRGEELREEIDKMLKGWHLLTQRRQVVRAWEGSFRTLEVTRNRDTGTYNPHIHCLVAVKPEYFRRKSGLYLTQEDYMGMWQHSMALNYAPTAHIESVKVRRTKKDESKAQAEHRSAKESAAKEASKYCVKDKDWIGKGLSEDEAALIVKTYTEALRRKRLLAFGGILREIARDLGVDKLEDQDDDLVHLDDESIREDVARLIETYHWRFGADDYVLDSVELV